MTRIPNKRISVRQGCPREVIMKSIRIAVLILCACFVSVGWAQPPEANALNNWSQFLRTNMQRSNPYETVLNVHNVGQLRLKWSYQTNSPLYSSPAVANGILYVGASGGGANPCLYALNANTGTLLWNTVILNAVVNSSPAVWNGMVYFGTGSATNDSIYALNSRTGALVWSYPTSGWVFSSPTVVNGVVYIGSNDGNLYALDAKTGSLLWSYPTGAGVITAPAVANGVVYVGSEDSKMYALNASAASCCGAIPPAGGCTPRPSPATPSISPHWTTTCTR
jgi:outer membrane protein assembly factor BamB